MTCVKETEAAFITAFDSTLKMFKPYKEIAWDTDIWATDEPTHFLHKNCDKFIGRPLESACPELFPSGFISSFCKSFLLVL